MDFDNETNPGRTPQNNQIGENLAVIWKYRNLSRAFFAIILTSRRWDLFVSVCLGKLQGNVILCTFLGGYIYVYRSLRIL